MPFVAGRTYKIGGFTPNISQDLEHYFTACGLIPGGSFQVTRLLEGGHIEVQTRRFTVPLPRNNLDFLTIL